MRSEYYDQIHPSIPYVCWIQDYMPGLWTDDAGASLGENDLVVCRSSSFLAEHFSYPRTCLLGSSNLTSTATYSDEPVAPEDLEAFRCDVSYVGHGWQTAHQLAAEIEFLAPGRLRRVGKERKSSPSSLNLREPNVVDRIVRHLREKPNQSALRNSEESVPAR